MQKTDTILGHIGFLLNSIIEMKDATIINKKDGSFVYWSPDGIDLRIDPIIAILRRNL